MSDIRIILTETLRDDYHQLPKHIQRKFDKQLRFLADNPRHPLKHVGGHEIVDRFGRR